MGKLPAEVLATRAAAIKALEKDAEESVRLAAVPALVKLDPATAEVRRGVE